MNWTSRSQTPGIVRHYTSRLAHGDQVCENRGDDQGVLGRHASDGEPVKLVSRALRTRSGDAWQCDGPIIARRGYDLVGDFIDVLALDLDPTGFAPVDLHEALWKPRTLLKLGPPCYAVETADGLERVSARYEGAGHAVELVWWLDPQRDWSPVRTAQRIDGKPFVETRIKQGQYGKHWFPNVIAVYRSTFNEGREPETTIVIDSARFNEAGLPDRLTPLDIGVDVGTTVVGKDKEKEVTFWDGSRPVPAKEYRERVKKAGTEALGAGSAGLGAE